MYSLDEVKKVDPEIAQAIVDEQARQNSHIELIASENWVSKAVMAAMGSPLTNKYAEGYPGKRYYDANALTLWRIWRSRELRSSSDAITQTYSLIPAHRPTWQCSLQYASPAIPSWE